MGLPSSNFSLTNTNTPPACARTSAHASHLPLPMGSARGEAEFENCPLAVARGQPGGLGCEPKIRLWRGWVPGEAWKILLYISPSES